MNLGTVSVNGAPRVAVAVGDTGEGNTGERAVVLYAGLTVRA
jgi:hypothetical protein